MATATLTRPARRLAAHHARPVRAGAVARALAVHLAAMVLLAVASLLPEPGVAAVVVAALVAGNLAWLALALRSPRPVSLSVRCPWTVEDVRQLVEVVAGRRRLVAAPWLATA